MRAKAVLFDKDGTLLDFQRTWGPWVGSMIAMLSDGDDALADDLALAWGYDRRAERILPESEIIAETSGHVAAIVAPYLPSFRHDQLMELLDSTAAAVQGVQVLALQPFLVQLSAMGLQLGVATNDSEGTARAQLRSIGVEQHFEFIAGYDSGHTAKPAPDMCLAFAEQIAQRPANIVMVGDSAHDLQAGRAAGMQTAAVLTGVANAADLAPLADIILPDIGHLPGRLMP